MTITISFMKAWTFITLFMMISYLYVQWLLQPDEMRDIVELSSKMEQRYDHLFDSIIVNDDLDTAASELLHLADSLEKQPQWVPVEWAYH